MEPCRSLALLTGSLGLVSMVVALSTNFWIVAMGPSMSAHTGLWPSEGSVAVYIRVTQSFSILATLCILVSVVILALSFFPLLSAPGRSPLFAAITALTAALFMIVAMAVYTSERWVQVPGSQIQVFFGWSFYVGWVSVLLLLCTGALSMDAYCGARRPGYEAV